jgi:hypothetical protein
MLMLCPGVQQIGVCGGGEGGAQHGGGLQLHDGGGEGGEQQPPAAAGRADASHRVAPAINARTVVLTAMEWLLRIHARQAWER